VHTYHYPQLQVTERNLSPPGAGGKSFWGPASGVGFCSILSNERILSILAHFFPSQAVLATGHQAGDWILIGKTCPLGSHLTLASLDPPLFLPMGITNWELLEWGRRDPCCSSVCHDTVAGTPHLLTLKRRAFIHMVFG